MKNLIIQKLEKGHTQSKHYHVYFLIPPAQDRGAIFVFLHFEQKFAIYGNTEWI